MVTQDSGRIVIADADLWRPVKDRSAALRDEHRGHLDGRRLAALIIDGMVLAPIDAVIVTVMGPGAPLVVVALTLAYFFVAEALTGQTLGKRAMGLRVVKLDGGPLNVAACAARNLLLLIDALPGCYVVALLTMFATRGRRQRLGDLMAGTVVTTAADHPHVGSSERFRTGILVGYPVIWLAPALVLASLLGGQADRDSYLTQANATCASALSALQAQPNVTPSQARQTMASVEDTLRVLRPPADLRAAHARLLAATHRQRVLLWRVSQARGVEMARIGRTYRATVARNEPVLRELGYPACA